MTSPDTAPSPTAPEVANWRIIVDSIGDADASLIKALKRVTPVPETHLATLLYQAPAQLMGGLERATAEAYTKMLGEAGLNCRVLDQGASFEPGDARHELALVVRDVQRMEEIVMLVVRVLGADPPTVRKILCTSPTVLLGKVSANTASDLKRRFEAVGVDVVVSQIDEALFDVFLGECSTSERMRAVQMLRAKGMEVPAGDGVDLPLLATGLEKKDADWIWDQLQRTSIPVKVINRDFESYDVRLERAKSSPEMIEFLTRTTGMPEKVAHKVLRRLPLVTHPGVSFTAMIQIMKEIDVLGGEATAELLAFQAFDLEILQVGDIPASTKALQVLGGLESDAAYIALRQSRRVEGPMTPPQTRWLQAELQRHGTKTKMVRR